MVVDLSLSFKLPKGWNQPPTVPCINVSHSVIMCLLEERGGGQEGQVEGRKAGRHVFFLKTTV